MTGKHQQDRVVSSRGQVTETSGTKPGHGKTLGPRIRIPADGFSAVVPKNTVPASRIRSQGKDQLPGCKDVLHDKLVGAVVVLLCHTARILRGRLNTYST